MSTRLSGYEHYMKDVKSVAPELERLKNQHLESPDNPLFKKMYEDLKEYSDRAKRLALKEVKGNNER